MARRFVLVGLMVLFQDTMMQLIVGTLLAAAFLLLQVQAAPYKKLSDDYLASASSLCLLILFLCATEFKHGTLTGLGDIQTKMSIQQKRLYVLRGDALLYINHGERGWRARSVGSHHLDQGGERDHPL